MATFKFQQQIFTRFGSRENLVLVIFDNILGMEKCNFCVVVSTVDTNDDIVNWVVISEKNSDSDVSTK